MLQLISQIMMILSPLAMVSTLCFSALGLLFTLKALKDSKCIKCPALRSGYRLLACLIGVMGVNFLMSACESLAQYIVYMTLTM